MHHSHNRLFCSISINHTNRGTKNEPLSAVAVATIILDTLNIKRSSVNQCKLHVANYYCEFKKTEKKKKKKRIN